MPAPSISPAGPRHIAKSGFVSRRPFLVGSRRRRYFDNQPPVPVMPETLLRLELLLGQPSLNLSMITETILHDLGATLQVMRASSEDRAASKWPERRIEDCVVHLGSSGLRHCLKAELSSLTSPQYFAARRLWRRARTTAELSLALLRNAGNVSSADAYLAGLFREIGSLPALLHWTVARIDLADIIVVRRALIEEWQLPPV